MGRFVLDNSIVMAWGLDEDDRYADAVMALMIDKVALVPGVWPLEFANALLVAERRRRLTKADIERMRELVLALPITVVPDTTARILSSVLVLAREQNLSSYDASYLDLAMKEALPLATVDDALRKAARRCRVSLVQAR